MSVDPSDEAGPSKLLPCVIPQVTRSFRGPLYSPFIRASPDLKEYGITQDRFLAFVDGLNERFIPHTMFFAVSVGSIPVAVYLLMLFPVAQYTMLGLRLSTIPASVATALIRTKIYLDAANTKMFHLAGLHVSIMPTKKMLKKVGYPYSELQLSLLETTEVSDRTQPSPVAFDEPFDNMLQSDLAHAPFARRINALDGYSASLNFDVPALKPPSGYFRRMAASNARGKAERQEIALARRRRRMNRKYREKMLKVERIRTTSDDEIAALKAALPDAAAVEGETECTCHEQVVQAGAVRDKQIADELRKAERVRAKHVKKEEKTANQLWWIVVRERKEQDAPEAETIEDLEDWGFSEEFDVATTEV